MGTTLDGGRSDGDFGAVGAPMRRPPSPPLWVPHVDIGGRGGRLWKPPIVSSLTGAAAASAVVVTSATIGGFRSDKQGTSNDVAE